MFVNKFNVDHILVYTYILSGFDTNNSSYTIVMKAMWPKKLTILNI